MFARLVAPSLWSRAVFLSITGYEHKTLPGGLNAAPRLIKPLNEPRLVAALDNLRSASPD